MIKVSYLSKKKKRLKSAKDWGWRDPLKFKTTRQLQDILQIVAQFWKK